jgi:hypothetical protein
MRRCGGGQDSGVGTTARCEGRGRCMEELEALCRTRILVDRELYQAARARRCGRGLRRAAGLAFAVRHSCSPSSSSFHRDTGTAPSTWRSGSTYPSGRAIQAFLIRHRWYRAITPKTRVMIGVGVMAYAGAGLFLSDKAEEKFGLTPTDKDLEELKGALPKITTVDRKDR